MTLSQEARKARARYMSEWRKQHRERINEYQRDWRKRNKAKVQEYNNRYWEKQAE